MNMRMSVIHSVQILLTTPFGTARHPPQAKDRLGNPQIDFPIAIAFGDKDTISPREGSDIIVKNNRYFSSGKSQIFTLKNTSHQLFLENPDEACRVMFGFFDETITGKFEFNPNEARAFKKNTRTSN